MKQNYSPKYNSYNYRKLLAPAREMRKGQTESEERMWSILRKRQFHNLKFLRQKILGEFIADFYCHEIKLVIEIDAKIHESLKERDSARDDYLKTKFDLKIFRYTNDFILNSDFKIILDRLESDLKNKQF